MEIRPIFSSLLRNKTGAFLIAAMVGPVVTVYFAERYGWQGIAEKVVAAYGEAIRAEPAHRAARLAEPREPIVVPDGNLLR